MSLEKSDLIDLIKKINNLQSENQSRLDRFEQQKQAVKA